MPVLTDPSTSICIGTSATLNVSGADTYTWTPATGLSATTGASVTANPTTTTTYTIRGTTTATGCSTTKNITVTVANAPVINVNDATICLGNSVTLNATGANTFSWTPATGLSTTAGASVTANPTTTTTYTVTGSSGAGCTASKNVTVTVNPNPTISIPNGVICNGNSIDLNATGADTYVWTPATGLSATTGAMVKASPTNTTKYTVTGTKTTTGCSAQGTTTVTVNPNPTVVVNSGSICPGFSLPLTATGADNFNWTNNTTTLSGTTGATVTATPTATTAYTVRGTNTTTGCYSDAISTVTVNEVPQIDATFTNPLTCGGNSGTITITGFRASSSYVIYYEKDGVGNTITASANAAGKIILNNLTKGVYDKIEARLTGCISNRIGSYTLVDPSAPATPSLTNTGPICSGNNFTLNTTYSQANATYTWTGPSGFNITTTTNSTTVNNATVAAAGIYKLFVTLANCNSPEISTTVVINQTPDAPLVTSPVVYCQRATASALNATAATSNSMQWYTTATGGTASTTAPTPLTATNGNVYYYVSQKTVAGCESPRATILVTTSPVPNINATTSNPTTCLGTEGYINITGFERSLAYTINYKKNGTLQTVTLTSNTAGEIKIVNLSKGDYSDIQVVLNGGCLSNMIGPFTLIDPAAPQTPTLGNNGPICSGNDLTLSTTFNQPSTTYIWTGPNGFNTNSTTNSVTLNNATVAATGTYKLIVKVANCNSPEATTDVTINQTPDAPTVTSPVIYCQRATPSALNATAATGNSLQWYTIATGGVASTTAPTPSTATNGDVYYYVSQKSSVGCEGPRARILVTTKTVPNIDARSFNPTTCLGNEGYLNITGFEPSSSYTINYKKNGTAQTATLSSNTTGVILLGNLGAGTYTDIQVALNGCVSNMIGPFTLSDPAPPALPILSNDGPICSGNNLTLSTTFNQPTTTYIWTGPNGFNTNTTTNSTTLTNATVAANGTYKLIVKAANCNSPEASTEVIINPTPLAPIVTSPVTYCQRAEASPLIATALNNNTLQWYTSASGGTASTTAPTPSTATNGSVYYYVSQKTAAGCEGPRATILVTTKPIPRIAATSTNPTTCFGNEGSITISGFEINSPYTINYKKNDTLKTVLLTSNATGEIRLNNLTAGNYTDIEAALDGCISNRLAAFTLTDPIPLQLLL